MHCMSLFSLVNRTGSSFGTMGILFPLIGPLAWTLGGGSLPVLLHCFGAVYGGSLFGNMFSPIADDTILTVISEFLSAVNRSPRADFLYGKSGAGSTSEPAGACRNCCALRLHGRSLNYPAGRHSYRLEAVWPLYCSCGRCCRPVDDTSFLREKAYESTGALVIPSQTAGVRGRTLLRGLPVHLLRQPPEPQTRANTRGFS